MVTDPDVQRTSRLCFSHPTGEQKHARRQNKTLNTYNIALHGNKVLLAKARAFELLIREALPSPLVFRGSPGRLCA